MRLTLDKMVNETERVGKRNIVHTIKTPTDIEELKAQLNSIKKVNSKFVVEEQKKKSFFASIKNFLDRKKK